MNIFIHVLLVIGLIGFGLSWLWGIDQGYFTDSIARGFVSLWQFATVIVSFLVFLGAVMVRGRLLKKGGVDPVVSRKTLNAAALIVIFYILLALAPLVFRIFLQRS